MRRVIEYLELLFRHAITYPLLRLLFRNPVSNKTLDLRKVKKILILRYDRIGDMIVTIPIFRNLKRLNPRVSLGIVTSGSNAELSRGSPYIDATYVVSSRWVSLFKEILAARREHYDVVLNFIFNRTTTGGILANLIAPRGFKVGQGDDKYQFYFNRLLKLPRSSAHMVETLAYFIKEVFGVILRPRDLQLELAIDERSRAIVDRFLATHGLSRRNNRKQTNLQYVVLNVSASDEVRKITAHQGIALGRLLCGQTRFRTVLIHAPNDHLFDEIRSQLPIDCLSFPDSGIATLLQVASLIEGALLVVSPDTSVIHFASATQTPVLGFFTRLQYMHEWFPYRVRHERVIAPQGQPIAAIPVEEICHRTEEFIRSVSGTGRKRRHRASPR